MLISLTPPGMSSECARRGTGSVSIDGGVPVCGDLDYEVMEEGEIKKKESKKEEQPDPELPNYYELSDDEKGQYIVEYLLRLAEEGRNVGYLKEIFSFYREASGKVVAPGDEGGVFDFISNVKIGSFEGTLQFFFSGVSNFINHPDHNRFDAYAPSMKPILKPAVNASGNIVSNASPKTYFYTTFEAMPYAKRFVFQFRILEGSAQSFANSVINPMRRNIPPH